MARIIRPGSVFTKEVAGVVMADPAVIVQFFPEAQAAAKTTGNDLRGVQAMEISASLPKRTNVHKIQMVDEQQLDLWRDPEDI
jgi:hypothetical protein